MNQELLIIYQQAKIVVNKAIELMNQLKMFSNESLLKDSNAIDPFIFAITIFSLSCFIGYYVVWKVTPSLHTPLMSITNAISGIIIIGALMASSSQNLGIELILAFLATFIASINIFGGFIITERMLEMFKKKKKS